MTVASSEADTVPRSDILFATLFLARLIATVVDLIVDDVDANGG